MESVGDSSDVQWKTSGCNRKRSVTDSGQTSTSNVQRVDEAERSRRLASVSAGRRSSSHTGMLAPDHVDILYARTAILL